MRGRAARAMERLGVDEALIGDLIEDHRDGRSRPWLWRQTAVAVAHAIVRAVRLNPTRAAATAFLSTAFLVAWFSGTLWLYDLISASTMWTPLGRSQVLVLVWHVYCVPLHATWLVGCVIAIRFVARNSRDGAVLVVFCAIVQFPADVWFGWSYIHAVVHPMVPLPSMLRFYVGHVVDALVALIGMPAATMAAGLWAVHRR